MKEKSWRKNEFRWQYSSHDLLVHLTALTLSAINNVLHVLLENKFVSPLWPCWEEVVSYL